MRPYGRLMGLSAYDLSGRTAFVTGAAGGIGRASAVLLAEAGAVVHCADIDEKGLAETESLIHGSGGTAVTHTLDVTDRSQVRSAVDSTGGLDIVAAIAGIMHTSTVLDTRDEDLDRVLAVNFKGVLHTCQEAARVMISSAGPPADGPRPGDTGEGRGRGSIITMASSAVDASQAGLLCYSVAKAAVVQLTRTLATELGPHAVRVNAVAPGWVRTPMTDRHDAETQARVETAMIRRSPLRRVGEPEDIAHAVLHLASDASSFTTGQIFRPNGCVAMPW